MSDKAPCTVCGLIPDNKRHCCPPVVNAPAPLTWDNTTVCFGSDCPNCEREQKNKPAPTPEPPKPEAESVDLGCGECTVCFKCAIAQQKQMQALRAELAEAKAEIAKLRETNSRLNRRVTIAEGIVLAKARDESAAGRSLGRSLANAACSALRAELEAERTAREKAEAERDELALLTVPTDADAEQAVRLRIAEARVEHLEGLIVAALEWEHKPMTPPSKSEAEMSVCGDNSWNCCSRKPWHAEARAILAARSAKGGAK